MGSVGSVKFQIVPCCSLYFSKSIGPFQYNQCKLQGFYCTCHFQSSSLFFVYFGFLCFQVSSESNFCSDTRGEGGQLFGFIYSVALWEGRSTANIAGVCVECSQCLDHTWFAPAQGMCAFPVYTAQAPGCSAGELS